MNKLKKTFNFIARVYKEKCPNCGEGNVFEESKSIFKIPEMHERCSKCAYRFYREPGYFIGAMYLSYALAVLQGIIAFLLYYFFLPQMGVEWILLIVTMPMLLLAKQNYKWSRILYIHIFPW